MINEATGQTQIAQAPRKSPSAPEPEVHSAYWYLKNGLDIPEDLGNSCSYIEDWWSDLMEDSSSLWNEDSGWDAWDSNDDPDSHSGYWQEQNEENQKYQQYIEMLYGLFDQVIQNENPFKNNGTTNTIDDKH